MLLVNRIVLCLHPLFVIKAIAKLGVVGTTLKTLMINQLYCVAYERGYFMERLHIPLNNDILVVVAIILYSIVQGCHCSLLHFLLELFVKKTYCEGNTITITRVYLGRGLTTNTRYIWREVAPGEGEAIR